MRGGLAAVAALLVALFCVATPLPGFAAVAQPGSVRTGGVARFNVAATHSPRLDRQLAGAADHPPVLSRSGAVERDQALPTGASAVQGIDVASFQHPDGAAIDWSEVASAGYKFAFIKVSEGSYYTNPYYAGDASGALAAGMFAAPYAFGIPNYSGGALQADYALDQADYTPGGRTLPLILDIEYDPYAGEDGSPAGSICYGLTPDQMVTWIAAFTAEVQRRTGEHPAIYTTAQWWQTCTGGSTAFSADPLWIAGNNTAGTAPVMPAAWHGWTYWQYTNQADVPGIGPGVDTSYLSSTALQIAAPAVQSDQAGRSVSVQVSALAGGGAVNYDATGLPGGLQLSPSTGLITGTLPGRPATSGVSVTATATGAAPAVQHFAWYVHGAVRLGAVRSHSGSVGSPAGLRVPAADSLPGCTLRFSASGLPRGLTMNSCGLITGWFSVSGHYQVSADVTDSSGTVLAHRSFGWNVAGATGAGPSGQIRLRRDGKCLQELGATDVAVETCGTARAQRWTVAANGSVRQDGRCLAAISSDLSVARCTDGGQRWQLRSDAALRNLSNGRCLADTGATNGSRATAAACYATTNSAGSASTPGISQQWTLPAGPLTSGIAGLCASDWHRAGAAFGEVTLRRCNTTGQQAWTIEPDGSVRADGDCLRLDQGKTAIGTQVRLVRCGDSVQQAWQLTGGPLGVQLFSPAAGLCLDAPGTSPAAGTALVIGACVAGAAGVSWRVS